MKIHIYIFIYIYILAYLIIDTEKAKSRQHETNSSRLTIAAILLLKPETLKLFYPKKKKKTPSRVYSVHLQGGKLYQVEPTSHVHTQILHFFCFITNL